MNKEHYHDPTADTAVRTVSDDEMRLNLVITICKAAAKLGGFKIMKRIELLDVRNGKNWR